MTTLTFKDVSEYVNKLNDGSVLYSDLPEKFQEFKNEIKIPVKPEEPEIEECCGSGCSPCVNDLYSEKLENYEDEIQKIVDVFNKKN